MDIQLKVGENSEFVTITDKYNKPLPSNIEGYCAIGDKSGDEIMRIQLQKVPHIDTETNSVDGYYLLFQVTPELSEKLGVGKYKYGIYIFTKNPDGSYATFREFRTGAIVIKDTYVHMNKELNKLNLEN